MPEANDEPIPGYRLINKLGSGGFGEVWKAEAPGGLMKAVKVVFGNLGGDDSQAQRELKGLTRVKDVRHPFVLSVERFELVEGKLVIVMELADMDLADRLGQCQEKGLPGIPRDELLKYLTEAAEALDLMNSKYEVQHLDIKPSNIFVVGGHVKVADFGLAKDLEGMRATVTGGMTPVYAAPETFNGWAARQTDQYSLAIVFQELLTGTRPFPGPLPPQYMLQHLTKEPDLSAITFADRRIVRKALAKDPKERFETCAAFVEALKKSDPAAEKSDDPGIEPRRRPAAANSMAISRLTPINRQGPLSPVRPMTPLPKPPSSMLRAPPTRDDSKPASVGRWAGSMLAEPIIGIDLGTTNSVVAILEGREPKVIANQEGARLTPSVVAFTEKGERLVGQSARGQATVNPKRTIASVKRFIGRRRHECDVDEGIVSYELAGDAEKPVQIVVGDKHYTPQEISAAVLAKLKEAAEEYLGKEVRRAVITVPANFNEAQRQATKDAGEIAGLTVERIVNEPTAAALAYGLERSEQRRIVVFDLGGGTFDVTILKIRDGIFDVLATCGDTRLGGDDFDAAIVNHLSEQFKAEQGIDPRTDPLARQRLKEAAEIAKKELSSQSVAHVNLPFLLADAAGPKHLSATVTRLAFEKMTGDLLDRCKPPMLQALSDARMTPPDVDEVVLVGGSSRMPHVRKMVRDFFGKEPSKGVNPDEAISLGAAIQGGILDGRFADLLLLDVTPLSLGLETQGGVMTVLVERNTTVPTVKREIFTTARADQREVGVHVLQGERPFARDNRSLGKFWLESLQQVNNTAPQVEVTFTLDANGILNVSAKDVHSGQARTVRIESSSGLSQEEIQRMRADAENYSAYDKAKKEMLQAAHEAHQSCVEAERALYEHPKMPEVDRKAIQAAIAAVRAEMEGADSAKLHLTVWQLEQALRTVLEPAH